VKVLYLGHIKEGGGWAEAATNNIRAMDEAGIDVAYRDIKLTASAPPVHPKVLELEKKSLEGCDYCIQHVLPHHMVGTDNFKKNIGFVELESSSIEYLGWLEYLMQMDEVWVANNDLQESLTNDGLPSVKTVNHTHDIDKYTTPYKELKIPQAEGTFKFYFIGDFNDRKNLAAIVRCFHSEFDISEPVSLVIKTNKFGHNEGQVTALVNQMLTEVKGPLRMYPDIAMYKKDIVITGNIPEENIYALHQYCDCFMGPSHGEAWSLPAFEAMAFGNTPICTHFGGPKDFIDAYNTDTGSLIPCVETVCDSKDSAFPDMFTARECWMTPSEAAIKKQMRYYFENQDPKKYKIAGLTRAKDFSYPVIAEKIKEALVE